MFATTGSVMLKAIADNIKGGCKKPLCWGVAYQIDGDQFVLDSLIFWTKKGATYSCRELKKATGTKFYPVACSLKPKNSKTTG